MTSGPRRPLLSRILVLLAVLQVVAPSVAAIADAWRLDRREAYVHLESETSSSCVVVHADDCRLCSIATGVTGDAPPRPLAPAHVQVVAPTAAPTMRVVQRAITCNGAPRAPPALEG